MTRKLGKHPPRHDVRTLHLANFLTGLPASPPLRDWNRGLPSDLGMMANDQYGDCGFAGQAHAVQTWTSDTGKPVALPDAVVLGAYAGCTGFSPGDPSSDQGVVLLDALSYWRKTGIGGHKIGAYVKVDHHNLDHVKAAINLFGGVYMGAALPTAAQHQTSWVGPRGALRGDDAPGTWGGHCMWAPAYDASHVTFVTWGQRQVADWQWWLDYVDEAYACVSVDWVTGAKTAPNGFDLSKLNSYLARL